MSQRHPTLETQLQRVARTLSLAAVNVWLLRNSRFLAGLVVRAAPFALAMAAAAAQAQSEGRPHPDGFGSPSATPVPSSLLLVMAGFAVLLGWRWWRSRTRVQ
jgi:hypothetical protein